MAPRKTKKKHTKRKRVVRALKSLVSGGSYPIHRGRMGRGGPYFIQVPYEKEKIVKEKVYVNPYTGDESDTKKVYEHPPWVTKAMQEREAERQRREFSRAVQQGAEPQQNNPSAGLTKERLDELDEYQKWMRETYETSSPGRNSQPMDDPEVPMSQHGTLSSISTPVSEEAMLALYSRPDKRPHQSGSEESNDRKRIPPAEGGGAVVRYTRSNYPPSYLTGRTNPELREVLNYRGMR